MQLRLSSLEHAHCCTTSGPDQPVHFVHKTAHEKDAAPGGFKNIFFGSWIGDVIRIESRALIVHADFDSVRRAFESNVYGLVLILLVTVKDGVGHGLAHGHIDTKRGVFSDT